MLRSGLPLPGYSRARNAGRQTESNSQKRAASDSPGSPGLTPRARAALSVSSSPPFLGHRVPCQMPDGSCLFRAGNTRTYAGAGKAVGVDW